jgi:ankyrin repeat protein
VADKARRAIVQINEAIGSESSQEYETAALMVAAEGGHTEKVRRMLAEGADVNAQEESGLTALMMAAAEGHTDTVKLLLDTRLPILARHVHKASLSLE